ncbi:Transposase, Mutator family (plasmid) [Caballeronia sp. SBC1]|uniref:transposase n=1 Tax=Caballeronia sp. SBC1 TaxID=2705548 RepID=UPI00140DCEB9|nr:transposase [Caballeronia sp. SBC1]QIN67585.1 Transposase, Mutator family [Caballeronia sp. SBC1]
MATTNRSATRLPAEALVAGHRDLMKALMKDALQEVLEAEMTEQLGATSNERTEVRSGYGAGYCGRGLIPRIGKLELCVPRDRHGEFPTALFERYARSERHWSPPRRNVCAGRVHAQGEGDYGHSFSASAVSAINKGLDATLAKFAHRPLEEGIPVPDVDACRSICG